MCKDTIQDYDEPTIQPLHPPDPGPLRTASIPKQPPSQLPMPLQKPEAQLTRSPNRSVPAAKPVKTAIGASSKTKTAPAASRRRSPRKKPEHSDVLISAVISTSLLTHLHHVLQRAEVGADQEGRQSLAGNYAQLRKVLCMDARSMEDASASGTLDEDLDQAA